MKNPGDAEFWREAARSEGECLDPVQLEAVLEGRATAEQTSHAAACAACATELSLLSEFTKAEVRPDELDAVEAIAGKLRSPVPQERIAAKAASPWWALPVPRWALALAAAVLVVGMAVQLRMWREPALGVNDANDSTAVRSSALRILEPAGTLAAAPAEIRWEAAPGATAYHVRLLEVDGNELWSADATEAKLALPASAQAFFVARKTLSIQVEARDEAGRVLRSGTAKAVVIP
jgi:hypothetical protein